MAKSSEFTLTQPLPGRNAFAALRQQLSDYLVQSRAEPGSPFYSENELTRITGLSRNTIRKSLDQLVVEGWIERRPGSGMFIGPRSGIETPPHRPYSAAGAIAPAAKDARKNIRLGVLLSFSSGRANGWYAMEVLRGLESAAATEQIVIELLSFGSGLAHVRNRILQTRPDVIACLAPDQSWALTIAEARLERLPVLITGTRLMDIGVPTICEENVDSAKLAVRYLYERGHRKIAFMQDTVPAYWAMHRYHGYVQGMADCGLEADPELSLWIHQEDHTIPDPRVEQFLRRRHATALILGSAGLRRFVGPAIVASGIKIPDDLSLICFDQAGREISGLGEHKVTILSLPLEEMGQTLARHARLAADGKPVEHNTVLPCTLVEGTTVAELADRHG